MKQTWHAIRYKTWQTGDNRWSVYEDQETFDFVLQRRIEGGWQEAGRFSQVTLAFEEAARCERANDTATA